MIKPGSLIFTKRVDNANDNHGEQLGITFSNKLALVMSVSGHRNFRYSVYIFEMKKTINLTINEMVEI